MCDKIHKPSIPACSQTGQRIHGQEIRDILACGDWRAIRIRSWLRDEKLFVFILRRKFGNRALEMFLISCQSSLSPLYTSQEPKIQSTNAKNGHHLISLYLIQFQNNIS